MIMHAFKDYHFLELQDDNGDIVGYIAIEQFGTSNGPICPVRRCGGSGDSTTQAS